MGVLFRATSSMPDAQAAKRCDSKFLRLGNRVVDIVRVLMVALAREYLPV